MPKRVARKKMTKKRIDEIASRFNSLGFSFIQADNGLWYAIDRRTNKASDPGTIREAFQWADGFAEGADRYE